MFFFLTCSSELVLHGDAKRRAVSAGPFSFVPTLDAEPKLMMCTYVAGKALPIAMSQVPLTQLPADVLPPSAIVAQATNAPPSVTASDLLTRPPPLVKSATDVLEDAAAALREFERTNAQHLFVPAERPHAIAVAEQDAPVLPPSPSYDDSDDETDTEAESVVLVRRMPPVLVHARRMHDIRRPPLVFGGGAAGSGTFPRSQHPCGFLPFKHESRELGYTVLVRHNAHDWVRNLTADAVTRFNHKRESSEARAELAWRRRALTEFDIEMEAMNIAWRRHYGVTTKHNPTKIMMVVDVALLSRYIIDRYGIQTTTGRAFI